MRRLARTTALLAALCLFFAVAAHASEPFPDLNISGTLTADDKAYLGLAPETESFALSDLEADLIFVEVFSMYCPVCQRDVPVIEDLYYAVEDQGYRPGLALLGIGAGNSQYEVDFYKKKYGVRMPLFPDADYVNHKKVGSVGTPFYLLLKKEADGTLTTLFVQEGGVQDKDAFIKKILKLAATAE